MAGSGRGKEITFATYGANQTGVSWIGLDLLPQAEDVRTDNALGVSLAHVVAQGDPGQVATGKDAVGMLHQIGQQLSLTRG